MMVLKVLFIVIEVVCCLLLTGIILLQKSKSEGLGMAFGSGMGESLFGARAGNVLSKATVILGLIFLVNTVVLGVMFSHAEKSLVDQAGAPPISQPEVGPPTTDVEPAPDAAKPE